MSTATSSSADARLAELEDTQAILDTLYQYAHSIDYGLEDDWVDCFVEDAVWETRRNPIAATGKPAHRYRGHAELRTMIEGHTRPPVGWHKHMLVEPRIRIDGDRCEVDCYMMRIDAHPTGAYIRAFGRYRDRLVRCPDGRWRFEERIAEIDGTHPLAEPSIGPDLSQGWPIEEIKRLKARYCHLVDDKRWAEWGDLLTEDAEMWFGSDQVIRSRDAIVAYISGQIGDAVSVHDMTMPDIQITGLATAEGSWSAFAVSETPSGTTRRRWVRYEDRYALGDDGRWRISWTRITSLRVEER